MATSVMRRERSFEGYDSREGCRLPGNGAEQSAVTISIHARAVTLPYCSLFSYYTPAFFRLLLHTYSYFGQA